MAAMPPTDAQAQNQRLIQQGLAALGENRAADARAAFEAALEKGGESASLWLALAIACRDMNDTPAMLAAIDRSLSFEARNPRALILRAEQYLASGDRRAAAAFFHRALQVAPPPAQTPADLTTQLSQARAQYDTLAADFERHLDDRMAEEIARHDPRAARVSHSLDLLTGRKKIYYQQPHQYYFPGLPQREFYDPSGFDWAPMLEAETDVIRDELRAAMAQKDRFSPYVTAQDNRPHHEHHGMKDNDEWSAFYLWEDGAPVTENAALCPKTVAIMEQLPLLFCGQRSPSVLFSMLAPHAKIPPHTGMVNTRLICHLPLIVPDGCGFRVGNDVRAWQEGKLWLFDDTIEHEAWNDSDQTRVILLFEVWKPELSETEQRLVTRIFDTIDAYDADHTALSGEPPLGP